jgi:cob(I)alamin adenosyltransferase
MRALGHGLKVCVIQFIKGTWEYGELLSAKRFEELLDFHVLGEGFIWTATDREKNRQSAQNAWRFARERIASDKYHLVILDEFTYLMNYGMIAQHDVLECLSQRKQDVHVVITGRDAPQSLVDAADLVTEMIEMKHPFKQGIQAQKGIEF